MTRPSRAQQRAARDARSVVLRQLRDRDDGEAPVVPAAAPRQPARGRGLVEEWRQRLDDRVPPGLREVRWRIGSHAAWGVLLVAILAAVSIAVVTWRAWPDGETVAAGDAVPARSVTTPAVVHTSSGSADAPVAVTPGPTGAVVVHVVGRVLTPGVVSLPTGSRVADALAAAGGAEPDADLARVNLARVLADGEQIVVPAPGEAPPADVSAGSGDPVTTDGSGGGVLDLNTATAADLDELPGIGEVLARRIVEWREEEGTFSSVEDLGEVRGIGPTLMERIRPLVRV